MVCDCGHEPSGEAKHVCAHLLENPDNDHYQIFTGQGRTYRLVCPICFKSDSPEAVSWKSVCEACFKHIESEGYWEGIRGMPEVRERPSTLSFLHRVIRAESSALPGSLRLIQPITGASGSVWIGLTADGVLGEIDFGAGENADASAVTFRSITTITPDDLSLAEGVSLICSADGKLVCLAETLGKAGLVIETLEGRRLIHLIRDGYRSGVSPFPTAFVNREEQTLLVHSPAWNRLDVLNPWSGEILTARPPTGYRKGEPRPPHYLDYFHGRLLPSPDGRFIADDGWVWMPIGVVRTWDLHVWLANSPWESEDGPSMRNLPQRGGFWGGPMCWTDATTLAVWGYGSDDMWLIPAVCLFDVVSGERREWFPGPEVAPMTKVEWRASLSDFGGRLFFDRYLFAVSEKFGVGVWDLADGARLLQDASFAPVAYHPRAREFLSLLPDGSVQLSHLIDGTSEK